MINRPRKQFQGTKKFPTKKKLVRKAKTVTPREAAIDALSKWLKQQSRIEPVMQMMVNRNQWEQNDRALFVELLYGTIRWSKKIEWILSRLSSSKICSHPVVRAAAYIGVYQFLFLDRIPDYAIVDTAVEVSDRVQGPIVAGWVNAVLRRLGREIEIWSEKKARSDDLCHNLTINYSHPRWMIDRWIKFLDADNLVKFLDWNNRRPQIIFRMNPLQTTRQEILTAFERDGIGIRNAEIDPDFFITEHDTFSKLLEFVEQGLGTIQDISQGLVARIVHPQSGEKILDLCSAPGGKTGHIAELCGNAEIIATDKDEDRLKLVKNMIIRNKYTNVRIKDYDDVISSKDRYDAVLIDAPCTGTGVLSRRPDLRWRRSPQDVDRMAAIQQQLLRYAADRISVGGRIVYSTCSVEPEENERVIERFLEEYNYFREESVDKYLPDQVRSVNGRLRLYGFEIGGDGVFAVRLIRFK